jgi:methylphosphotriester-DNA--protein-cysteine methyltransferase
VQRRFLRATGLTYGTIRQIERAERTAALLAAGASILDAVEIAGYSDQAHMTRSLQRFLGKTPGTLVSPKA